MLKTEVALSRFGRPPGTSFSDLKTLHQRLKLGQIHVQNLLSSSVEETGDLKHPFPNFEDFSFQRLTSYTGEEIESTSGKNARKPTFIDHDYAVTKKDKSLTKPNEIDKELSVFPHSRILAANRKPPDGSPAVVSDISNNHTLNNDSVSGNIILSSLEVALPRLNEHFPPSVCISSNGKKNFTELSSETTLAVTENAPPRHEDLLQPRPECHFSPQANHESISKMSIVIQNATTKSPSSPIHLNQREASHSPDNRIIEDLINPDFSPKLEEVQKVCESQVSISALRSLLTTTAASTPIGKNVEPLEKSLNFETDKNISNPISRKNDNSFRTTKIKIIKGTPNISGCKIEKNTSKLYKVEARGTTCLFVKDTPEKNESLPSVFKPIDVMQDNDDDYPAGIEEIVSTAQDVAEEICESEWPIMDELSHNDMGKLMQDSTQTTGKTVNLTNSMENELENPDDAFICPDLDDVLNEIFPGQEAEEECEIAVNEIFSGTAGEGSITEESVNDMLKTPSIEDNQKNKCLPLLRLEKGKKHGFGKEKKRNGFLINPLKKNFILQKNMIVPIYPGIGHRINGYIENHLNKVLTKRRKIDKTFANFALSTLITELKEPRLRFYVPVICNILVNEMDIVIEEFKKSNYYKEFPVHSKMEICNTVLETVQKTILEVSHQKPTANCMEVKQRHELKERSIEHFKLKMDVTNKDTQIKKSRLTRAFKRGKVFSHLSKAAPQGKTIKLLASRIRQWYQERLIDAFYTDIDGRGRLFISNSNKKYAANLCLRSVRCLKNKPHLVDFLYFPIEGSVSVKGHGEFFEIMLQKPKVFGILIII